MPSRSYRDLIAWQKAVNLAVLVYEKTRGFPKEELYGLMSQMRRAAVSVPSNLAEGQGRAAQQDFLRFTNISMGSVQELETQFEIARRLGYVQESCLQEVTECLSEVARLIRGLQKSLM